MAVWQLGLEGVDDAWDALAGLFEARGATLDAEPGRAGTRQVVSFASLDRMIMDAVGAWLDGFHLDGVALSTRLGNGGPWQEGWRAIFSATQVSERLWVRPAWESALAGRTDIVIDPTRAFGAGFHPTTAACLRLTDTFLATAPPGAEVLDVGTGTGILAIAAAHLGARVVGIEIDGAACVDAASNAALNGVADRIRIEHGVLRSAAEGDTRTYDLVLANELATVLIKLAPTLLASARRAIVLSGIQASQEAAVLGAYGVGPGAIAARDRIEDRGWVTLLLAR